MLLMLQVYLTACGSAVTRAPPEEAARRGAAESSVGWTESAYAAAWPAVVAASDDETD